MGEVTITKNLFNNDLLGIIELEDLFIIVSCFKSSWIIFNNVCLLQERHPG